MAGPRRGRREERGRERAKHSWNASRRAACGFSGQKISNMKAIKIWSILLAVLCTFCQRAIPCGLSTHIEIAHRALEFFGKQEGNVDYKKLLLNHQDAYQAGSLYPDAFYSVICKNGIFHQVSEDTHWAPFLNVSIHYIRKNYPQPWEEDTEKLVAFLFGIASHMVADVGWHSLGIEQGFLHAMAAIDFHDSYSEAHTAGDFGGDVLSQFELDFDYLKTSWYIPVKDLVSIYEEYYGREAITEETIVDCTYLLLLQLCGEMITVGKLYSFYARKSPFLVDKFYEYFLGGVDDMAFASNNIFQLTSEMLNYGSSSCFIPENPLFIRCEDKHRSTIIFKQSKANLHSNETSSLPVVEKNITYIGKGVYFDMPSQATNYLQFRNSAVAKNWRKVLDVTQKESSSHITKPNAAYFLKTPYARLGWTLASADLNNDGYDDLIAGAPGYSHPLPGHVQRGRVYVVYGNKSGLPHANLDLDQEADEILEGNKPSGRFGSAIAVLDFNDDGVLDLAVGAPSVGSQEHNYRGSVYVFFGTQGEGFYSLPNVTIICQEMYCNFGWSLLAADVDGDGNKDLVVGSPYAPGGGKQRGFVASFYSFFNRSSQGLLFVSDANWMVKGESDYAWFGSSLSSIQFQNMTLLFIGSPSWKSCAGIGCYFSQDTKQTVGKVYGYIPPSTQSWFALTGHQDMGRLGASLATGLLSVEGTTRQVLVVGAPAQDTTSRVAFLTSTLHQAGTSLMYSLTDSAKPFLLSTFHGDRKYSRFGGAVHLHDLNNDGLDEIIMTSSLQTEGLMPGLFGEQAARVYIYSGNQTVSGNVTDRCKSWTSPCPEDWAQYIIISPEERARFGNAVTAIKSGAKNEVVIAAERSSAEARLSGRLFIYTF